jgi:endonuclease/exonuclease/phosphatase family metal-dependent hydrolase
LAAGKNPAAFMFMKNYLFVLLSGFFAIHAHSQQPVYQQGFDHLPATYKTTAGMVGKALDLSAASAMRQPLVEANALAGYKGSFTVSVAVKAASNAKQAYSFLESSHTSMDTAFGWQLGINASGAWYCNTWNEVNGKKLRYSYAPTVKQTIADNKWHQIHFSYDTLKQDAAFYFDGRNVAIIHTPGLRQLMADTLLIGGQLAGLANEWETFNGYIDEVKMYKGVLAASDFSKPVIARPVLTKKANTPFKTFKVMNYNILHGGHETGKETGVQRVVEVIKASAADIVSMQETYGSGPEIADALGYYFYLRSSNLAVFSRYPIQSSLKAGMPFNSGGVNIQMPNGKTIAFFTNWLTYPFDYWEMLEKNQPIDSASWWQQQNEVNAGNLRQNLKGIETSLKAASENNIPIIFCGDFNTGSHLDWVAATRHLNNGYIMPFPTTKTMEQYGFSDSYRQVHPDPLKDRGITWSPMFSTAFKDRIDYIYYKSTIIKPVASITIATHPIRYPSDHAALLTSFEWLK